MPYSKLLFQFSCLPFPVHFFKNTGGKQTDQSPLPPHLSRTMSLNPFLHPRNPYRTRPDFTQLAKKYPDFRKVVTLSLQGKATLDFKARTRTLALDRFMPKMMFICRIVMPSAS